METLKALKYATYIMGRPFDGFWDLKHEKRGNLKAAMILVVVTIKSRYDFSSCYYADLYSS